MNYYQMIKAFARAAAKKKNAKLREPYSSIK